MQGHIPLAQIMPISDPEAYKLHLACWNGHHHPLDVFARSRAEWASWNSYRGAKNRFNRPYVISFMQFYHETDTWLFGGIYQILSDKDPKAYTVALQPDPYGLIGRLKVTLPRPGARGDSFKFEKSYHDIYMTELLKDPYAGETFCGYEKINHDFEQLETIFKNERPDWKAALSGVKGVYLVADKSTGKKYVGSAYNGVGIWARWRTYLETGHGYNDELTKLIDAKGINYARKNFRMSLLEYRPMKTDDKTIIEREGYWKEALLTRGAFGYNKN